MTDTIAAEGTRLEAAQTEIRTVPFGQMFVDPHYQRPLRQKRVQDIADEFNWDAFGLPVLSYRGDGKYAEVDGQHRIAAATVAGHGDAAVTSEVFFDLTLAEEAALYRMRNQMEKVGKLDTFRARLVEGEPNATAMARILDKYGWRISMGSVTEGVFSAVAKLEMVYNLDPNAAEQAVATLTRAWGHAPVVLDGRLLEGMGRVYARFGDVVDMNGLVDRLARFPGAGTAGGQAAAFIGQARGLQPLIGGTVGRAVAEKIIDVYNVRRKKSTLPSLRSPQQYSAPVTTEETETATATA